MAFDDLGAELALLINQMETPPEDPHEVYLRIYEKLNEFKALGLPLRRRLRARREGARGVFCLSESPGQEALARGPCGGLVPGGGGTDESPGAV
jgi:hypothetical protein